MSACAQCGEGYRTKRIVQGVVLLQCRCGAQMAEALQYVGNEKTSTHANAREEERRVAEVRGAVSRYASKR